MLVTHSAIASCATFLFLPHFDVICDLLLNRRTATWNLFVNQSVDTSFFTSEKNRMTNQLASLAQRDYFYLDPFWSVNLGTYIIKKAVLATL